MLQYVKVSNVFNTLTLKQIFWKMKTFFKKFECCFLVETTKLKTHHVHSKLFYQKPILRQIEWWLQNEPITKSGILLVTTSLFGKSVSVLEPLTDFIGCTNASNTHICILCKCCYTPAILRYLYLNNIFVFSATPCWFAFWVFVLRVFESGLITSMRVDGRKHIPSDFAHVVFRT